MLNAASRAAAIATRAKEIFSEDPEVYEACREWFEFRHAGSFIDRLEYLASRAQSKAEASVDEDDRFKGDDE